MILQALELLEAELLNYINVVGDVEEGEEPKLTISAMADQDSGAIKFDNLGIVLINVEEERIHKAQTAYVTDSAGQIRKINPELKLNLHILIAANFDGKYSEALKFLGYVVDFFQAKSVFDHQTSPELNENIQKLIVEMQTLTFEQLNHIWGTLGSKYMPSVMYKVRMLVVQKGQPVGPVEPITIIQDDYEKR